MKKLLLLTMQTNKELEQNGNTIDCMTMHPYISGSHNNEFQSTPAFLPLASKTATDVGMHGLLPSQSCYHSVLVPCWFALWSSGRFLHPYIPLISLKILFTPLIISLLV